MAELVYEDMICSEECFSDEPKLLQEESEEERVLEGQEKSITDFLTNTVLPEVYRITVEVLNQYTLGRAIVRAMEQAQLKRQEQHIKAQIKEMVNEGAFTVVSIDVLDELENTPVCTVEIQCDQIEDGLQPGEVIHNLVY